MEYRIEKKELPIHSKSEDFLTFLVSFFFTIYLKILEYIEKIEKPNRLIIWNEESMYLFDTISVSIGAFRYTQYTTL